MNAVTELSNKLAATYNAEVAVTDIFAQYPETTCYKLPCNEKHKLPKHSS